MYIYAFGSICRGELDFYSDIDLLAISRNKNKLSTLDPHKFSLYSENRIEEYWKMGNPFAWHLYKESKIIYSNNGKDFIKELGTPSRYSNGLNDLIKFKTVFLESVEQIKKTQDSFLFDIST
ncbi:nucleotidyltransferase domain-containing protein, partial [Acinetobacter variabilis]|uniref:nucleotidyltransferase domain-containing protein n=1 Tax=Acinetobacter variabilis TaxID=70346 RepID=UPI0030FA9595